MATANPRAPMAGEASRAAAAGDPRRANHWGMKVGTGGGDGFDYVLCPAGNYPGTIVGLFDIGHQAVPMKDGRMVEIRKLVLVFELVEKRPDGRPFILVERYTWSMLSNSNFYAVVTNVTGEKYQAGDDFNPLSLMGTPVMVTVTNNRVGEKTYHNVGGVSSYPKNFPEPPDPVTPIEAWSVLDEEPMPAVADSGVWQRFATKWAIRL